MRVLKAFTAQLLRSCASYSSRAPRRLGRSTMGRPSRRCSAASLPRCFPTLSVLFGFSLTAAPGMEDILNQMMGGQGGGGGGFQFQQMGGGGMGGMGGGRRQAVEEPEYELDVVRVFRIVACALQKALRRPSLCRELCSAHCSVPRRTPSTSGWRARRGTGTTGRTSSSSRTGSLTRRTPRASKGGARGARRMGRSRSCGATASAATPGCTR